MSMNCLRRSRLCAGLLSALSLGVHAQAQTSNNTIASNSAPDSGLYTTYSFDNAFDIVYFSVCGGVPGSDGCYGGGSMQGFGHIAAMVESNPVVDTATSTVWRNVYILDDEAGGGTSTAVSLSIYRLTTVVNGDRATILTSKLQTINLPLIGGSKANAYMASNAGYLFIGTDQTPHAVRFAKTNHAVTQVGGITPAVNVSSITSDHYGYVTVGFGGLSGNAGNFVFDPTGASVANSTGAQFMLGTTLGLATTDIKVAAEAVVPDMAIHYHGQAPGVTPAATTATASPDAGLYVDYSFPNSYKTVNLAVCGSLAGSNGCYGTGSMAPFGRVGAMIEGNPSVNAKTNTVWRDVYVVDQQSGGGSSTAVALYVYRITEVITAPTASVTVSLIKSIGLPLLGGSKAKTYLAANAKNLYIGTDQTQNAVVVAKSNYAVGSVGGFSPPINSSAITSDEYGYVDTSFGGLSESGFYVFGSDGGFVEDGGGANFLLGTTQALMTSDVNVSTDDVRSDLAKRMHIRFH
jgi:hypothetical protein